MRQAGASRPTCARRTGCIGWRPGPALPRRSPPSGGRFDDGKGCEADHVRAAEYFAQAAEKGNAVAQYRLGLMCLSGRGVSTDPEKALEWLKKASTSGHAGAREKLKGLVVP